MSIHLHIERIVLDGLPLRAGEGPAVHEAIELELTRLLGESDLGRACRQAGALASLPGAELRIPQAPGPEPLGREIAAAVHRSLVP